MSENPEGSYSGIAPIGKDVPEYEIILIATYGTRDERYRASQCDRTPIHILKKMIAEESDENIVSSAKANLAMRDRGAGI